MSRHSADNQLRNQGGNLTPVPYLTESYKSNSDGKVYGKVTYSGTVVASLVEGDDNGVKDEGAFEKYARGVAVAHKASISPADTHVVTRSFVV